MKSKDSIHFYIKDTETINSGELKVGFQLKSGISFFCKHQNIKQKFYHHKLPFDIGSTQSAFPLFGLFEFFFFFWGGGGGGFDLIVGAFRTTEVKKLSAREP